MNKEINIENFKLDWSNDWQFEKNHYFQAIKTLYQVCLRSQISYGTMMNNLPTFIHATLTDEQFEEFYESVKELRDENL